MKPVNVCSCEDEEESDESGVAAASGTVVTDPVVKGEAVRGVPVSDVDVTGTHGAAVLGTKLEKGASCSATDVLSLDGSVTILKSFQSGRLCSLVKSKMGWMAISFPTGCCEAMRLSKSATPVVSLHERSHGICSC